MSLSSESVDMLRRLQTVMIKSSPYELQCKEDLHHFTSTLQMITIPANEMLSYIIHEYTLFLIIELDIHPVYFEWTSNGNISRLSNERRRHYRLNDIESHSIRRFENKFLQYTQITHKVPELEQMSVIVSGNFHTILPIMLELSSGRCFTKRPILSKENTIEYQCHWLIGLPVFTLGQYIAARLESEIWTLWETNISNYSYQACNRNTIALNIFRQGLMESDNRPKIIHSSIIESLREIVMSTDIEKLKSIVSVSLRRAPTEQSCKLTSRHDVSIHRLWLLSFMLIPRDDYICRTFVTNTISHSSGRLLGTPLLYLFSPLQECSHISFQKIYRLCASEYYASMFRNEAVVAKNSTSVNKRKSKKKKRLSIGMTRELPALMEGSVEAGGREGPSDDEVDDKVINKAPGDVTIRELTMTRTRVVVVQLLYEFVEMALTSILTVEDEGGLSLQPQLIQTHSPLPQTIAIPTSSLPDQHPLITSTFEDKTMAANSLSPSANAFEYVAMQYAPTRYPAWDDSAIGDLYSLEFGPQQDQPFSFYSVWMTPRLTPSGGNTFAGVWDVDEAAGIIPGDLPLDTAEEESEGIFVPLTTASLRAHTVYHESQIVEGSVKTTAKRHVWIAKNRSEGFGTTPARSRRRVRSTIAHSVRHRSGVLQRNSSFNNASDARQVEGACALTERYEVPERDDGYSSLDLSNAEDPVVVILSSRLLRSEGTRCASINQQAILRAIIASHSPYSMHGVDYRLSGVMVGPMEIMSEDGRSNGWGSVRRDERPVSVTGFRSVASQSSGGSKDISITSLPTKPRVHVMQSHKYSDSVQMQRWAPADEYPHSRSRSLSMCSHMPLYRSNPNLLPPTHHPRHLPVRLTASVRTVAKDEVSDNMNLSDDGDLVLSSLLTKEINEFVSKLDAADAALRE